MTTSRDSMRAGFLSLLAVLLVAVPAVAIGPTAGCSTTSGAAGQASRTAADVVLPPREEEKLGRRFSEEVESKSKLHPDAEVQKYLRELGRSAVKAAGGEVPAGIEFEFEVIDDPETVNAFAGPGGQIYFYTGLLLEAKNTAEVMAVVCHEVAHVTNRHVAQRLVAIHGLEALSSAALGDNPSLVAKLAASAVAQGFLLKYSRDHEREADDSGFDYMVRTPYDPSGFVTFFRSLQSKGPSPPTFLSSHPSPGERVRNARQKIAGRENLPDKVGKQEHEAIVQRIRSR